MIAAAWHEFCRKALGIALATLELGEFEENLLTQRKTTRMPALQANAESVSDSEKASIARMTGTECQKNRPYWELITRSRSEKC